MNWIIFFTVLIVLLMISRGMRSKSFICQNANCDFTGKVVAKNEGRIFTLWVWECPNCQMELRQKRGVGGPKFILLLLIVLLVVWVNTSR